MSVMFEVFYQPPKNPEREAQLMERVKPWGGQLTFREDERPASGICLTFEFGTWQEAERAAQTLRAQGEFLEGPMEYGDD